MFLRHRHFCMALLIVMLLGMTAVSVHVATHVSADLQTCELCSGHANPAHAIPAAAVPLLPVAAAVLAGTITASSRLVPSRFAFRQRAPPRSLSV